jgi:hypothetical protein
LIAAPRRGPGAILASVAFLVAATFLGDASAEHIPACAADSVILTSPGGSVLYAISYRPQDATSGAIILVGEHAANPADCWGTLPDTLCAGGFEVWLPETDAPTAIADAAEQPVQLPWGRKVSAVLDALEDSVESVALVCVGNAGWCVPAVLSREARVRAVAWLAPRGDPHLWEAWCLPEGRHLPLLLISTREEPAGSALAADLFSRFNAMSELRIFSRGQGGCALLGRAHLRVDLRIWLQAVLGEGRSEGEGTRE